MAPHRSASFWSWMLLFRCEALAGAALLAASASPASAQFYQRFFTLTPNSSIRPEGMAECTNAAVGGVAVAGQWLAGSGQQYVSLHNPDGSLVTANSWATPGGQDEGATTIRPVDIGGFVTPNYIVAGFQQNLGGPGADLTLTMIDSAASVTWAAVYSGYSRLPDITSKLSRYFACVRNAPGNAFLPPGFAVVTTWRGAPVFGTDRGQFLRTDPGGNQIIHWHYLPQSPSGQLDNLSFTDLRYAPFPVGGWLVTGTFQYFDKDDRFPVLVRLDELGNVMFARAYVITPGVPGLAPDSTGLGISVSPTTYEVTITGRTNYFYPNSGAHVLRLDAGGAVIWARVFKDFEPGVAAINENSASLISVGGTDVGPPATGPGLLVLTQGGAPVLRREFVPPPGSPPAAALGVDAIANSLAPSGWAIAALKEQTASFPDLHLLRTDSNGRTGCFEHAVDPEMQNALVDVFEIDPIEQLQQQDQAYFREVNQAPLVPQDQIICLGHCTCPGDGDGNGTVNFADITSVLANFGMVYAPSSGPGDADCSGVVNFADITSVLANFGIGCS